MALGEWHWRTATSHFVISPLDSPLDDADSGGRTRDTASSTSAHQSNSLTSEKAPGISVNKEAQETMSSLQLPASMQLTRDKFALCPPAPLSDLI